MGSDRPPSTSPLLVRKNVEHLADHHNHERPDKSLFFSCMTQNTCSHPQLEVLMTFLLSSDKPDPPARVPAASDIRRASLTLSWYGPTYDGGSAVMSYHLEIWDSVEQHWKPLVSCNSTSYNVQVNFSQNLNKSWRCLPSKARVKLVPCRPHLAQHTIISGPQDYLFIFFFLMVQ